MGPTALGRWKIQFCHAESRAKILLSSVSGPPKRSERLHAGERVRARSAARSSMAMRTSSSQSMSSGVNVTSPASRRGGRVEVLADAALEVVHPLRLAEEAAREPGEPVDHRIGAEVHPGEPERGGVPAVALAGAVEHVGAVGGQRQLEQRAGEAGARLDQREQRARRTSRRLSVRLR